MKTIFLSSFHALISRNVLETGVLPALAARARVVLLVPSEKVSYFAQEFAGENIIVEGVRVPKMRGEEVFGILSLALVGVENHIVRGWKTEGKYVRYYFAHLLHALGAPFFFLHRLLRAIARHSFRTSSFDALFLKYEPDLVCTTDTFNREDRFLLTEALARKTPTVGMIRSWDNATTKGVLLAVPDHVLVANEILKEEMVRLHRVPAEHIAVVGIPHYDELAKDRLSREEFFSSMGLDPQKKLVLFAPGGKILYQHDREILELLQKHAAAENFGAPVQFLVRFPPADSIDITPVKDDPLFVIDDPGTKVTKRKKDNEMSRQDAAHLNDSLYHSDVVLTLASTMIIDGMVFDKPVVVFAFEPAPNLTDPIEKFGRYVHLRRLLGSGLVTISKSEEEFVSDMRQALAEPQAGKEARAKVVEQYAFKLGGSAERAAAAILARLPL